MKLNRVVIKRKNVADKLYIGDDYTLHNYLKNIGFKDRGNGLIIMIGLTPKLNVASTNIMKFSTFKKFHREIFANHILNDTKYLIFADNYKDKNRSLEKAYAINDYCENLKYPILSYYNISNNVFFTNMINDNHILTDHIQVENSILDLGSEYIDSNYYLEIDNNLSVIDENMYSAIHAICEEMRSLDREHIYQLNLNENLEPINYTIVSIGNIDSAISSVKNKLATAILSEAKHSIIFHNHPSGDPTPSPHDNQFTQDLYNAYNVMGVNFLDHIIVGKENFSYRCNGALNHLAKGQFAKLSFSNNQNYDIDQAKNQEKYKNVKLELGEKIKTSLGEAIIISAKDNNAILLQPDKSSYISVKDIRYNNQNKLYEWDSGKHCDNIEDANLFINNKFEDIKNTLETISNQYHNEYVKSILSIESGINNQNYLDNIYNNYIEDDTLNLIDDNLNKIIIENNMEREGM